MEDGHVVRTVFLDGEIASHTPGSVWCETGVKALDDALMGFCRAPDIEPFADPVLISAISALGTLLPRSRVEGSIVERQHVFTAAWMTKFSLPKLAGGPGGGCGKPLRRVVGPAGICPSEITSYAPRSVGLRLISPVDGGGGGPGRVAACPLERTSN